MHRDLMTEEGNLAAMCACRSL